MVTVSAALRCSELDPPSLWLDDAWVALISRHSWNDIWLTSLSSVGFRAIIGVMTSIFGDSTTAAQLFPFAAGLATIPAAYLVARRLDTERISALLSAGLVAASPLLVTYSTRVKQYTGDALLTLAIVASVIWIVENPRQFRRWWLLAIVSCLSIVFSGTLLLVVGPAVLALISFCWRLRREWIRIALPPLLALGGFSAFWYFAILKPGSSDPALLRFWGNNFIVLNEGPAKAFYSSARGIYHLFKGTVGGTPYTLIGAGLFFLAALIWRTTPAVLLLFPLLGAIAAAAAGRTPIGARTDAYLVPLIALVIGLGFDSLFRSGARGLPIRLQGYCKYVAIGLGTSLIIIDLPQRIMPLPYWLEDVRSLTKIWEDERTPTDRTLTYCGAAFGLALYSNVTSEPRRTTTGMPFFPSFHDPQITVLEYCDFLDEPQRRTEEIRKAVGTGTDRIWLLASHYTNNSQLPFVKKAVSSLGFSEQQHWVTRGNSIQAHGDAELTLFVRGP
jgi:hypothetical protein